MSRWKADTVTWADRTEISSEPQPYAAPTICDSVDFAKRFVWEFVPILHCNNCVYEYYTTQEDLED